MPALIILIGIFWFSGADSKTAQKVSFDSAIGKQAPDFELQSIDGNFVKLSDYRGKFVVLFFNEGAMCYPGCWNQIAELGKDDRLNNADVASFSVVIDKKSTWDEILQKVTQMKESKLLFDADRKVSLSYDVLSVESSMHPGYYPGHTYFIIGRDGSIKFVLDDPSMGIRNDELVEIISKL